MSLISNLVPLNLESERERFFAYGGNYNPQFVYQKIYSPKVLTKYGQASEAEYLRARAYLDAYVAPQTVKSREYLSFDEMKQMVAGLCAQLQIAPLQLVINKGQNSRFMVTRDGVLGMRWPTQITREQFQAVLDHEVQTHYLRRLNDLRQEWSAEKRPNALWKKTDEGLAMCNSRRHGASDLHQAALLYELVYLAASGDFIAVYKHNLKRGIESKQAFVNSLRVKRGLTDTSLPGGFTKELVYWEGYQQVSNWLADPAHDIRDLYWGKVGLEELEQLRPRAVTEGLVYPTFVTNGE